MPKAITVYCRKWSGVTKAEISEAREVKGTCQYPFNRSNFVMNTAGPMLSIQSSILGSGKESGTVTALTLRKSVQKRAVPSDLGANKHGELQDAATGLS